MRCAPPGVRRRLAPAGLLLVGLILAFIAVGPAAQAAPAVSALSAHATGNELVQVGSESPLVLAVNAETTADMVEVDILMPPGFSPDQQRPLDAKGGGVGGLFVTWNAHYAGREIVAGGAGVADGGILIVSFTGEANRLGTLPFVTVTRAADGTTVRWDGPAMSAHPAAMVRVLRTLTSAQVNATTVSGPAASHPPSWVIGVAAAGGLVLIGCVLSGRRRRASARIPGKVPAGLSIPGPRDRR